MVRIFAALSFVAAALFASVGGASAQGAAQGFIEATCGSPSSTYAAGSYGAVTIDTNGKLCVNATVSASISGFAPGGSYSSPLSVSGVSSNVALPTGAEVIVYNVGNTNAAYCKLGTSNAVTATTSDDFIAPQSWIGFTVGSNTYIACITASSTTTVNVSGGTGIPTGAGGGGGGGGGSNPAAGATGSAVPADASYNGLNVSGTLRGQTGVNPTGSVYAAQNDLSSVGGTSFALGQTTESASLPVTIASNQGAVGTVNPTTAANWGVGATGAAVPANAVYLGITSGGNLTGWNGAVTNAGTFAVQATLQASATTAIGKVDPNTIATWGLATLGGASAPTNALSVAGEYLSSPPTYTNGQAGALQMTAAGSLHTTVDNTIASLEWNSDANATTLTGSQTSTLIYAYNGSTVDRLEDDANKNLKVAPQASPAGGASNYGPLFSAASNNATNVKSTAGTLYTVTVTQSTTTALELKLYNTSSSPTCSSATGLVDLIPIPSNVTSPGYHLTYPVGRAFSTGISFCLVAFGAPAAGTDNSNAVTGDTVSMTYE